MPTVDLYLMSPPHPKWAIRARANFRSRNAAPVDARQARREWLTLARAIEARGGTVVALEAPDESLTGMPYAAECGQIVDRPGRRPLFLLPRMAHPHRQPERRYWAGLVERMGMEVVDPGEGIWEAQGDVASFAGVTLLFFGGRTDRAGMLAAAKYLPGEQLHLQIREPAFHGNMALLPLEAVDRMLVCPGVFEADSLERLRARFGPERLLEVTEAEIRQYATNGLPMGRDLLAPSILPGRVADRVTGAGMTVHRLEMPNLCERGGGASRCLVSFARVDAGAIDIPAEHRLEAVARKLDEA